MSQAEQTLQELVQKIEQKSSTILKASEKQYIFQAIIDEVDRVRRARESVQSPMFATADFNAERVASGVEHDQDTLERVLVARHKRILAGKEQAPEGDGWDGVRISDLASENKAPQYEHRFVGHATESLSDLEFLPDRLYPLEGGGGFMYPS